MSVLYASADAALPIDESFLKGLGIHRIPVPVPFVEAGGPANVYVLENADGTLTLFDCGIATPEAKLALGQAFAARGLERSKISRIIVSHGHIDHYGNAQELAEETGCAIWLHPADLEKVCGEGRWNKQLEKAYPYFMRNLGVARETLDQMVAIAGKNKSYARQVDPARVKPLSHGQRFDFKHLSVEVLHLPGHTPGLVCLYSAEHKLLFADDHVLARVSPNPLLDLTAGEGAAKFRALSSYLKSAKVVHAMELDCVLPGHGEGFKNHRPLLDGLFGFYARRQEKLLKRLGESPATVNELVTVVFPRADPARLYLMLSEVLGNLEVLEDEGKIRFVEDADVCRFALAA